MEDAHCKTTEEVLKYFNTSEDIGLSPDQVKQYQAKYGPNGKLNFLLISFLIPNVVPKDSVCNKANVFDGLLQGSEPSRDTNFENHLQSTSTTTRFRPPHYLLIIYSLLFNFCNSEAKQRKCC